MNGRSEQKFETAVGSRSLSQLGVLVLVGVRLIGTYATSRFQL
jgi:hypothetical protein